MTGATVSTRLSPTEIHFVFTHRSDKPRYTLTPKLIDHIDTSAAILTRIAIAVVNIIIAPGALKPRRTHTLVGSVLLHAGSTILARIRVALVDLCLTIQPAVVQRAFTFKPQHRVSACAMNAWLVVTSDRLLFAVFTNESFMALTFVAVCQLHTGATILAWVCGTITDLHLTFAASKSRCTLAGVQAFAGVKTGAIVLTGLMVGAIV